MQVWLYTHISCSHPSTPLLPFYNSLTQWPLCPLENCMAGAGLYDPLLSMVHEQDDLHTTKPVIKYTLSKYFVLKIALNIKCPFFLCPRSILSRIDRHLGEVILTVHTRNCLPSHWSLLLKERICFQLRAAAALILKGYISREANMKANMSPFVAD